MATVTFNWTNWDTTNAWENLADAGNNANITYARDDTDVAGKFTETTKNTTATEYARKSGAGDTWASMFGIYPTNTVSQVRITTWKKKVVTNTKLTSHSVTIKFIDDSNATVATMISGSAMATATDASYQTKGASSLVSVGAAYTSGSTSVRLSLEYSIVVANSSGNSAIDTRFDDITVEITYALTFGLTVNNATQAQTSDNVTLTYYPPFTVNDAAQAQTSDNILLTQHQLLAVANTIQLQTSDDVTLTQHQFLAVANTIQLQTSDDVTLTQYQVLTVNDATQAQTSDNITLTYYSGTVTLTVQNSAQGQTSQKIALVTHFGIMVNIDLETGDTSQFSSLVNPDNDITVTNSAALAGTNYGMGLNVDDINVFYGIKNLSVISTSNVARARFYLNLNSLAMASGDYIELFTLNGTGRGIGTAEISRDGTGYYCYVKVWDDIFNQWSSTIKYISENVEHCIEGKWFRATDDNSGDGYCSLWVDGVFVGSSSLVYNYVAFNNISYIYIGCTNINPSATFTGVFYLDELIVRDDDTQIGQIFNVKDSSQAQISNNVTLTQHQLLLAQTSTQLQTSENVALTQHQILIVQGTTQLQTSDNIVLVQDYLLTTQSTIQLQTSGNVALTQHQILVVQDITQLQTSGNVVLTQHQVLVVNTSTQEQTATNITLTQKYTLSVNSTAQLQTSGIVALVQDYLLSIQSATQLQTSDKIALTQHQILTVSNAVQLQISDNIILNAHYILSLVNGTIQVQTANNIALIQNYILVIMIATQLITSDKISLGGGAGIPIKMMHYIRLRSK